MIVGLYQCTSPAGDVSSGFETLMTAMGAAAEMDVSMLVLPEIFLPGYGAMTSTVPEDWAQVEADVAALCRDFDIGLTLGLPEFSGGQIYNSAVAYDAEGRLLARHRKIQLFGADETALYAPGETYVVFNYLGTRFGLLVCYDIEFPEHARALAQKGAEVILVPTANMHPFVNVNQVIVPARAAENAVTVVYANYCGSEGKLDYVGLSGIYGPDGYSLASKGMGPGLCIAELPDKSWSEHGIPLATQIADLRTPRDAS